MEGSCYDNRELSWLKFNARVLEEADDVSNPLCERLNFASIYQSNLDEFFAVRIGYLYDQMRISKELCDNKTNMTCKEQIRTAFEEVRCRTERRDRVYAQLVGELAEHGIRLMAFSELSSSGAENLNVRFEQEIRPLLAPQVVGRKQPFPFLKDKGIYAVVLLGSDNLEKPYKKDKLGIVPCSIDVLPRLVRIPGEEDRYLLLEDLILHHLAEVFTHFEVKGSALIRILRNADIDPEEERCDDDADFRQVMEQMVHLRPRLAPIKLEYTKDADEVLMDLLRRHLELKRNYVFSTEAPLDLTFFSTIRDLLRGEKNLFYEYEAPRYPDDFDPRRSIFPQVEEKDRLLFFPYESMDPFLQLLDEAARDPDVVSVKMTLYRVASDSKVVEALLRAAENGKDVSVLVELRARFDEAANIEWSWRLENAGCSILYGLDHLKVHSKLCLITKKDGSGLHYVSQIGTGNYNEKTARLYTDFSLLTADPRIGAEVNDVFTHLYLDEVVEETEYLMVAPRCLRSKVLDRIDGEIAKARAGERAYVGAKMNSLTDKEIIDRLILASQAGVRVELIVRGACCLIAGVPGMTENIEIRSIVGRYLEHSRIYIFGAEEPEVYLSSADFMTRNTTRRVEVAVPLLDPDIRARVLGIFRTLMADNVKARVQCSDGSYVRVKTEGASVNAQALFGENGGV